MDLLYSLIIGAVAGWLAGKLMRGGGFGLLINIILGVIGGFVGNWLFRTLGININLGIPALNHLLTGLIGAVIVLFIAGLIKKK